jgi:hypothetical protein
MHSIIEPKERLMKCFPSIVLIRESIVFFQSWEEEVRDLFAYSSH